MELKCILLVLLALSFCDHVDSGQTAYQIEQEYYSTLVSLYQVDNLTMSDFIARRDHTSPRTVYVEVLLMALQDVDEVEGTLEAMLSLDLSWTDEVVNASGYNHSTLFGAASSGITNMQIPYGKIWTPNLVLFNSMDGAGDIGGSAYKPRYSFIDGNVTWSPRVKIQSSCSPDVTFYPFDKQSCSFDFIAWGTTTDDLMFKVSTSEWNMMFYEGNGEWDILETSTFSYVQRSASLLRLTITMSRKPLYFAFNIILPVLVLVILNGMVFLLPVESGERVGFSVTCFLSFVVLLNMIMDILPRSSSPMSYLCFYAVSMMTFSGATTTVVILQMRIFHKPATDKVPACFQSVARVLRCKCRKRTVADTEAVVVKDTEPSMNGRKKQGLTHRKSTEIKEKQSNEEQLHEVTWQELARLLDKFLFLLFVGGQAMFTLLFITPVASNA